MFGRASLRVPKSILILSLIETLVIAVSIYVGLSLSWVDVGRDGNLASYVPRAALYTATIVLMIFAVGLYNRQFWTKFGGMVVRIVAALILSFILLTVVFYTVPAFSIPRSILAAALVAALPGLILVRSLVPRLLDLESLKRRIVVIGVAFSIPRSILAAALVAALPGQARSGEPQATDRRPVGRPAARIEELELTGRAFGFHCIGYIDVLGETRQVAADRIIPAPNALVDYVRDRGVQEVVIAAEDWRKRLPMRALMDVRLNGIVVCDYQSFYERETGAVDLDAVKPSWFLFSNGFAGSWLHKWLKRCLDVVVSLTFLLFFLPLMLFTALVIRLESPGQVFYRQERIGFRGRSFTLLKFRSMRADAEKDGVPQWAAQNDARVTRVGAFIRKTRIDELPQIFNVLRGDMSFVGPRPERAYFVEQLAEQLPFYADRHWVKPGITGWAQLNYQYGASVEDAKIKLQYDLYYVNYYGMLLDIIIIIQTVRVVLWPQGVR